MAVAHIVALVCVVAIAIARTPIALSEPRARISWLASVLGAGALFTLGSVVDQSVLDVGGSNWLKLAQGLLATTAIWLLGQAAISKPTASLRSLSWWSVGIWLFAMAVTFAAIPRKGSTDFFFIENNVDQPPVYVYGVVHMAALVWVGAQIRVGLRGRRGSGYVLLRAGAIGVAIACASEIVDLSIAFSRGSEELRVPISALFELVFYPGVLCLVAGMAMLTLLRRRRQQRLASIARKLDKIARARGLDAPPFHTEFRRRAAGDALLKRFAEFWDQAVLGAFDLSESESQVMGEAERELLRAGLPHEPNSVGCRVYEARK